MNKDIFDKKGLDDLDKKIQDRMDRPTLVSSLKKKKVRKQRDSMSFMAEVEKYWYVYLILAISSLFTGTLGAYMGLAPYNDVENHTIVFQTDITHLFLAFVYFIAFVGVTEVMFAIGKRLFFTREETNATQKFSALFIMILAGVSILGTGISGGLVLASNISFLTDFVEIPDAAQRWIVIAIPALLTLYTFLLTAYHLSSDEAASERITRGLQREIDLDFRSRSRFIDQISREKLQETELQLFAEAVGKGLISAAQATAAMRAGKTLGQIELDLDKDLDGNHHIGTVRHMRPASVKAMDTVMVSDKEDQGSPDSFRN